VKRTLRIDHSAPRGAQPPPTRVEPNAKAYDRGSAKDEARAAWDTYLSEAAPESSERAKELRFCPRCGGNLVSRLLDGVERKVCPYCGYIFYLNPVPAAGAVIWDEEKVLWVRRAFEPKQGMWSLPAGFVEYGESAEACAIREIKEETNLDISELRLVGVYAGGDDPRTRVVLVIYTPLVWSGVLRPGDDATEAGWFKPAPVDVAFRSHLQAVRDAETGRRGDAETR